MNTPHINKTNIDTFIKYAADNDFDTAVIMRALANRIIDLSDNDTLVMPDELIAAKREVVSRTWDREAI